MAARAVNSGHAAWLTGRLRNAIRTRVISMFFADAAVIF